MKKITTLFNVPVFFHWSTIVWIPFVIGICFLLGGSYFGLFITISFPAVLLCLCIHEFSHVLIAKKFGYTTEKVTLYHFGFQANINVDVHQMQPKHEVLISIAGPLANVCIAVLIWTTLNIPPGFLFQELTFAKIPEYIATANIIIATLNLMPALPMDGGRILRGFISMRYGYILATKISARITTVMAILFIIFGVIKGMFLMPIIAYVINKNAQKELKAIHQPH